MLMKLRFSKIWRKFLVWLSYYKFPKKSSEPYSYWFDSLSYPLFFIIQSELTRNFYDGICLLCTCTLKDIYLLKSHLFEFFHYLLSTNKTSWQMMNNIPIALTVRITENWSRVFVARKACWTEDNTWSSKCRTAPVRTLQITVLCRKQSASHRTQSQSRAIENIKTNAFRCLAWWTVGSIDLQRGLLGESIEYGVGCKFIKNALPCPGHIRAAHFMNLLPGA